MADCRITGWNTWDPKGINRFLHPGLDLELILATMDVSACLVLDEYSMNVMNERRKLAAGKEKLPEETLGTEGEGEHHRRQATSGIPDWAMGFIRRAGARSLNLSRGHIELEHQPNRGLWGLDASVGEDTLVVRVTAEYSDDNLRFVLIARAPWGHSVEHKLTPGIRTISAKRNGAVYEAKWNIMPLATCSAVDHSSLLCALQEAETCGDVSAPAVAAILPFTSFDLTVGPKGTAVSIPGDISDPKENTTELTEAACALEAVIGWNLCWDALYGRVQLPVNKEWVRAGLKGMELHHRYYSEEELYYAIGPAMFSWDAAFGALMAGYLDHDYGKEIAKSAIMYNRKPDGGFSTCRMGRYQLEALTNPPVLTWACSRLFEQTGDTGFLRDVYNDLRAWYFWMKRERDRNADGLYEWGINPNQELFFLPQMGGRMESGLDNSPMYYDIPYSKEHGTYEMNCIDLCSFQALCTEELAKMAASLGNTEDAKLFTADYAKLKRLINEHLWNDQSGVYANRLWSGEFSDVITPTSFYPLIAGIPDEAQARRMIEEWIENPDHFGTEWALPSVDAAHPSYSPDGNYWRGRVWPPMNYLVYHGLCRYDHAVASRLAEKSLRLLLNDWRRDGHVHENYSALTGFGEATIDEGVCTCPFYTWGGLLALIALEDNRN